MFAKKVVESHSSESVGSENSNVNFRHQNALNHSNVPITSATIWDYRLPYKQSVHYLHGREACPNV